MFQVRMTIGHCPFRLEGDWFESEAILTSVSALTAFDLPVQLEMVRRGIHFGVPYLQITLFLKRTSSHGGCANTTRKPKRKVSHDGDLLNFQVENIVTQPCEESCRKHSFTTRFAEHLTLNL